MINLPGGRQADPGDSTRWRTSTIAIAAFLSVCLVVAGLAWKREHDRASAQGRVALAHRLALHAADLRDTAHSTARVLGLAAVKIHSDAQTRAGLTDTLIRERGDDLTLAPSSEVALSGDGRIALTSGHGDEVSVWDLTTWLDPKIIEKSDRIAALKGHKESVNAVALSFDGRTALTGDDDGTTILWDLTDPAKPIRMATVVHERGAEYANGVRAVALSRDGRTAVIAGFDDVTAWDLTDRSRPARLSRTTRASSIRDLRLSADGDIAVTLERRKGMTLWNLTDPSRPVELTGPAPLAKSVATAMSADGRVVVLGNAYQAETWNLGDRSRPVRTAVFDVPLADMYDMALTSDGKTALLAGPNDSAFLWNLSDPAGPTRMAALKGYGREINSVALSADGGIALAAGPGGVSLWNLKDLSGVVADPGKAACHGYYGAKISKADWARYTGSADWSDYGQKDQDTLLLCYIDTSSA